MHRIHLSTRAVRAARTAWLALALLSGVLPAGRALAQHGLGGGPTVTVTPGTSQFSGTGSTYTVGVTATFCSTTSTDFDYSTLSFTLDDVDVGSEFTNAHRAVGGCVYSLTYTGNLVLPQTNDGVHRFTASIEDLNGYLGSKFVTYTYLWPGYTPPKYAVRVTQAAHTKDVASGTGQSAAFIVTNLSSRPATYALSSHCARAATCTSISPASVTLDTTTRSATATLTFTAGSVGDTGTVTLVARNSGNGLSADADSASTDIMIPAPTPNNAPGVVIAGAGDVVARDLCLTISAGSGAAYECGDLRLVHELPSVTTRGERRTPTLLYNSAHAIGNVVVAADVTPSSSRGSLDSVSATVLVAGVQRGRSVWPGIQWTTGATRRIGVHVDTLLATGVYGYTLDVKYFWADRTTSDDMPQGQFVVVNRSASNFGSGWWLAGLEQLVPSGSDWLWVGGDGSTRLYRASGANLWRATTGSRPDSLYLAGSTYARTLPTGTRIEFNGYGQHSATRPLVGPATYFSYSGTTLASPLTQITVPAGQADGDTSVRYTFAYPTDSVRVTLYSGTTTRTAVVIKSGGTLTRIQDSDGHSVAFGYLASSSRVGSRTDRNSHTTTFTYDVAAHLTGHSLPVTGGTIAETFLPAESRGVPGTSTAAAQPIDSTYTLVDGPRSDVADVSRFWLNRYGMPARIRDPYGRETRLYFDATWPALPNEVISPGGTITEAWYSGRGLPDSTKILNLRFAGDVGVTSRIVWDSRFALPDTIWGADSTVKVYGYNADATVQFVQLGTNTAARIIPQYWAGQFAGLYRSSNVPGRSERDSVRYDPALGNPDSTMDTGSHWTEYDRDAFGRVVFTETQTSGGVWLRDSTAYDPEDRVIRQVSFGDPTSYTPQSDSRGVQTVPADTLIIQTSYDAEGNPLSVQRTAKPIRTGASTLTTGYAYDEAGRKTNEYPDYGIGTTLTYDPAGNLVHSQGERGNVTMAYDEMSKLVQRIAAPQTNAGSTCTRFVPEEAQSGCLFKFPISSHGGPLTIPGDTEVFAYDAAGNMTRADNKSARIRRTYSPAGLLLTDTLRTRILRYATEGSSVIASDFTSHIYGLRFGYDVAGRRDSLWHPDNLDPCGGPCSAQGYRYDVLTGRLLSIKDIRGKSISFGYTLAAQLDTVNYPADNFPGQYVSEVTQYDALGLPWRRTITFPTSSGPDTIIHDSLTYDWAGRVVTGTGRIVRTGDTQTLYNAYSGLGALVENEWIPSGSTPKLEEFRYDALGNEIYTRRRHVILGASSDDPQWRGNTTDETGRLVRTVLPDTTRLPGSVVPDTETNHQDGERRDLWYDTYGRTAFTAGANWTNFTVWQYHQEAHYYDGQGRLAIFEEHTGGYDSVSNNNDPNAVIESYRYDALGRRVLTFALRNVGATCNAKGCESTVQRYVWDGNDLLYETRGPASNATSSATVEDDGVGGTSEYGTLNAYGRVAYTHAGGIDRPVGLIRMNGSTILAALHPLVNWRGLYETATTDTGGLYADRTFIKWPGATASAYLGASTLPDSDYYWFGGLIAQQADASGLLYRRNRYYDPQSGRFTQPDPIGIAGGVNAYGFANGDPVSYSDPFGLCPAGVATDSSYQQGSSVVMVCADSTEEVRSGGDPNWRANNPGNLGSGAYTAAQGQVGMLTVRGHVDAVFPDMLTGWNALVSRLSTNGFGVDYPDKTLDQAMYVFAPPFQNNTKAYVAFVHRLTGLSGSERLRDLPASQLAALASAIFRYEGAHVGTVTYRRWQ